MVESRSKNELKYKRWKNDNGFNSSSSYLQITTKMPKPYRQWTAGH